MPEVVSAVILIEFVYLTLKWGNCSGNEDGSSGIDIPFILHINSNFTGKQVWYAFDQLV